MTEAEKAVLDSALELVGEHEVRLQALEHRPPPAEWVHSVVFLIDRYATRKTALGVATTLVAAYAVFQGVPGV